MLFRMVPKPQKMYESEMSSFRAVLFRMVPKQDTNGVMEAGSFRAVLFRMVPKLRLAIS